MKHFISSFSAAGLLAVMIISSCELPAEAALDPPGKSRSTSIRGIVENPAGDGVEGVQLSAGGVSCRSDKWGEFTIKGVARIGTVTLSAKKAGYKDYSESVALPPGWRAAEHDLQLAYAYKTTVRGKLSDPPSGPVDKSGIPIKSSTGGETVLTDAEGKYTIEVEHAGEFTLSAVVPDKGLIGKTTITPATTPEKPVSEENADPIALEEALRSFTLVLKDPLGNAVTSPVYTEDDFESSSGFPVKINGTPTNGIYKLKVIAVESFKVTAAAKDLFGESSLKVKYSDDDGKRYEARVPYQYSTTLEGRVTAGKRPIAGATITATSHKEVIISIIVSPAASHGSGAEERRALITRSRPTDSHGKYRIVVNHQGPFTIQAEKDGYKSYPHEFPIKKADGKYDFETGRTHVGIDLVLTQPVTGLSYTASSLVLVQNEALTPDQAARLRPRIIPAGAVIKYSVSPRLPKGLILNAYTGEITGTPTEESQIHNGTDYIGRDYIVTAQGHTAAGYSGSASHTINIRVGRALPRDLGYDSITMSYTIGHRLQIHHGLVILTSRTYTNPYGVRPHGLDDGDFHAEFVRIPPKSGCRDLSSKIRANGTVIHGESPALGSPGLFRYKVKVTGKGPYVETRIVSFDVRIRELGNINELISVQCYE